MTEAALPSPDDFMVVGRVRNAHGLRGEVIVEALTDAPDAVFAAGRRVFAGTVGGALSRDRLELHVVDSVPFKGGWRIQFQEIAGRTEAESWRERYLLAPLAELEPLAEDEVYLHELPGMTVELESGEPVGEVRQIYELPQGLVLDVARAEGSVIIPYERVVSSVDRVRRIIRVDPPEGLLD